MSYILNFSYFLVSDPLLLNRVKSFTLRFFLQGLVEKGELVAVFLLIIV
jgi:hypothetical protein